MRIWEGLRKILEGESQTEAQLPSTERPPRSHSPGVVGEMSCLQSRPGTPLIREENEAIRQVQREIKSIIQKGDKYFKHFLLQVHEKRNKAPLVEDGVASSVGQGLDFYDFYKSDCMVEFWEQILVEFIARGPENEEFQYRGHHLSGKAAHPLAWPVHPFDLLIGFACRFYAKRARLIMIKCEKAQTYLGYCKKIKQGLREKKCDERELVTYFSDQAWALIVESPPTDNTSSSRLSAIEEILNRGVINTLLDKVLVSIHEVLPLIDDPSRHFAINEIVNRLSVAHEVGEFKRLAEQVNYSLDMLGAESKSASSEAKESELTLSSLAEAFAELKKLGDESYKRYYVLVRAGSLYGDFSCVAMYHYWLAYLLSEKPDNPKCILDNIMKNATVAVSKHYAAGWFLYYFACTEASKWYEKYPDQVPLSSDRVISAKAGIFSSSNVCLQTPGDVTAYYYKEAARGLIMAQRLSMPDAGCEAIVHNAFSGGYLRGFPKINVGKQSIRSFDKATLTDRRLINSLIRASLLKAEGNNASLTLNAEKLMRRVAEVEIARLVSPEEKQAEQGPSFSC